MAIPIAAAAAGAAKGGAVAAKGGAVTAKAGAAGASGAGPVTTSGASTTGGSSGSRIFSKGQGFEQNLEDRAVRHAVEKLSETDEKKKERDGQKNLQALQRSQGAGTGRAGMGQGGMSKGKLFSSAAKILPGGDYGLDIAVILAGGSIKFFPWAFQVMAEDGLCKRNIYRLAGMVVIWVIMLYLFLILVVLITSVVYSVLRPWELFV